MLRRLGAFFLDILEVIVFAVAIFLFVYLLILRPHKIRGASMMPNYPDGEYLLTENVSYYFREPERGDVVVFKPPVSEDDEFIKRIIGLPGEKIEISGGKVFINGKELMEKYLQALLYTSSGNFLTEAKEIAIPAGKYLVLGDNRPHSSDGRAWGFIAKDKISGRAWLVYWPTNKAGFVKSVSYEVTAL